MFRIVDGAKVYNEVGGRAVPVNVSAIRNEFTGAVASWTVEEAGEAVDVPATGDVATIEEVIARFGCASAPYRFPTAQGGEGKQAARKAARARKAQAE